MFVDPERRPLAVARSFEYLSPFGANPGLQDGIALRKPGRIMLYEPSLHARACERDAARCERCVSVHVAKSGMPL